jgi:hypothetical protein
MALFDLLSALTDALWQQYEPELVELILKERNHNRASQQPFHSNDDPPF